MCNPAQCAAHLLLRMGAGMEERLRAAMLALLRERGPTKTC